MRRSGTAFAIAFCLVVSPAWAQSEQDEARQRFEEGVRLLEDSRFAAAASELERSLAIRESPPVAYNLGLAYRGMGRYLKAIALFERFLEIADRERYGPTRERVTRELSELRAGLVKLTLQVSGGARAVIVDRATVASRDGSYVLDLDPGQHRIEVRRPGHRPVIRSLELDAGSRSTVRLRADAQPLPARLVVDVDQPEATIAVDGRVAATGGHHDARLAPGRYRIRVDASGFETFERAVQLSPGSTERLNVTLEENSGVLGSWWFWTAGAVVVTGTAAAVFFLTRPDDPEPDRGSLGFVVEALP